jgi:biotin transport system substrate-specific component
MLGYLAAGAAGLPVFSGTPERGIGLAYMAGPTEQRQPGEAEGVNHCEASQHRGDPAEEAAAGGEGPLGDLVKIGLVAAGSSVLPGLRRVLAR